MNILIGVCENNKQGKRSGKVSCFHIEDFYFESPDYLLKDAGEPFKIEKINGQRLISFDGILIPFLSTTDWYSNMMWNGYQITANNALLLLNHLMTCNKFHAVEMWIELRTKVKKGQRITAVDLGWATLPDEIPEAMPFNPNQLSLF